VDEMAKCVCYFCSDAMNVAYWHDIPFSG